MRYRDLLDILIPRAERLGLVDPTSLHADAAELEVYLFYGLMGLVEIADIDAYTSFASPLVQTETGCPDYPMPEDFGRLILPRAMFKRGLYLFDGAQLDDLTYLEPNAFVREVSLANDRPQFFTVTQRRVRLLPTPDRSYELRSLYITRVERPDLDDEVLLSYPTALVEETLWRLASDANKLSEQSALTASRLEAVNRLAKRAREAQA